MLTRATPAIVTPAPVASEPLAQRWRDAVSDAARQMAALDLASGHPPPEVVHALRKSLKRMRALLRMAPARAQPDIVPLLKAVQAARRAFGAARELHVMTNLVAGFGHRVPPGVMTPLCTALNAADGWAKDGGTAAFAPSVMSPDSAADIAAMARAAQLWLRTTSQLVQDDDLIDSAVAGYRRARRGMKRAMAQRTPQRLHALRSRVVDHRYQMAFLTPAAPVALLPRARRAQRLRDVLGHHHDLYDLMQFAARHAAWSGDLEAQWRRWADRRLKRLEGRARPLMRRLFGATTRDFRRGLSRSLRVKPAHDASIAPRPACL